MSQSTRFVETSHGKLAYRVAGPAGGVPILLANRFRGTLDDWDPAFIDALAQNRTVVAFDSAGIGRSKGEVPGSISGMADVAADLVKVLGLGKVDLLGWSLGGIVAQTVALDHPQIVRRLIVAGSSPGGVKDGPQQHSRVPEVMSHPVNGEEDFLFLFFPETETARAAGRAYFKRVAEVSDRGPAVTASSFMNQIKAFSAWEGVRERLPELKIPVLVANGQHDVMIPAYRSYVLAQEVLDGKLILYPDAGHAFLFQYAEDFALEIERFLS
ncbi:alpha/beta hydrolase [Tardiphaga sp. P9-11]|uniref:alpha/beta fold hydrolase n=1 Tax=Tardiphaga sp. P9-11 TaxID=2024614 RepID=UPI0011F0CD8D|nr:alpha/beta hydrolase [Tardiphaga sp. P9-11]KAA0073971.1 alpha/beta hydrolase [Tardiphaga sp. P9-11]